MALLTNLSPLNPGVDPVATKLADLEARLAKLESVLKVVPGGEVTFKVPTTLAIEAGGAVTVKGSATVNIEAAASLTMKSSGSMTLKGATIAIN